MLFFHNLEHLIFCNGSYFVAMYYLLVKTEIDFCYRCKKQCAWNNQFITILADVTFFLVGKHQRNTILIILDVFSLWCVSQ